MSELVSVPSEDLNDKKGFLLAMLITAVGAVVIFILSKALFINQDFTGSIYENGIPRSLAGFSLLLFPYIYQRLAGKRHVRFSHLPENVVSFETYTLPGHLLLIYGILIAFALAGISLLLVWLIGLVTSFFITRLITILSWVILLITFYYLGYWTGSRNTYRPYLIVMGTVLGYTILELLVSSILDIESPLRGIFGLFIFLILTMVAALIGARAGKRRQLSNYVNFLLNALPKGDRQIVVDDLYREIKQRTNEERGNSIVHNSIPK